MDDGHYYARDNTASLYLGTVSHGEALIALETINSNFKLIGKLKDKHSKGLVITFSPAETAKLKKIVQSHMLSPLFDYKLPLLTP